MPGNPIFGGCALLLGAIIALIIVTVNAKKKAKAKFCGAWDPASVAELQALGAMSTYE